MNKVEAGCIMRAFVFNAIHSDAEGKKNSSSHKSKHGILGIQLQRDVPRPHSPARPLGPIHTVRQRKRQQLDSIVKVHSHLRFSQLLREPELIVE